MGDVAVITAVCSLTRRSIAPSYPNMMWRLLTTMGGLSKARNVHHDYQQAKGRVGLHRAEALFWNEATGSPFVIKWRVQCPDTP